MEIKNKNTWSSQSKAIMKLVISVNMHNSLRFVPKNNIQSRIPLFIVVVSP